MNSVAIPTSTTNLSSRWPFDFRLAPWLLAGLVIFLAFASPTGLLSLREVAVLAFTIQVLTAYQIARARDRMLSISSVFAVLWVIYFPLRLLAITFGQPSPYYFPAVQAATAPQLTSVWELTAAALLLFLLGQLYVNRAIHIRPSVDNVRMTYWQFFAVGAVGIAVTASLSIFHVSSGILGNVGDVALFAIAGISYLEAKAERRSYASLLLVAAAIAFGYLNGFKELMLLPLAAWVIGRAGAGDRIRLRHIVIVASATAVVFAIIQGQRDATLTGQSVPNPVAALRLGLGSYDLAYGVPADNQGVGIVSNAVNGLLYRLKGADYFIAITDAVPSLVPYQQGLSLWQPALSVLPGAKQFLDLQPQYKQLSLGRYIDQVFISQSPAEDPSSQSTTQPGDLYLNFGIPGVIVGMLIMGAIYAMFDRAFIVLGPVSAGIVAFAGLPLLELDANIAYALVTSGLRLGICAMLLTWISLSLRGRTRREPAVHPQT